MPLTAKGRKILRAMRQQYGAAKGKAVFYASINKGLISGVEAHTRGLGETPRRHRARA